MRKKLFAITLSAIMVIAMAVPTFAASSSTSTTGYGTLMGELYDDYGAVGVTRVDRNTDNAVLEVNVQVKSSNGQLINSKSGSIRGTTVVDVEAQRNGVVAYAGYGSHGVSGGSTYGSSIVYTYTRLYT